MDPGCSERCLQEIALTKEIIRPIHILTNDLQSFSCMCCVSVCWPTAANITRWFDLSFNHYMSLISFQDSEGFCSACRAELLSASRNGCIIEFSPKRTSAIRAICANQRQSKQTGKHRAQVSENRKKQSSKWLVLFHKRVWEALRGGDAWQTKKSHSHFAGELWKQRDKGELSTRHLISRELQALKPENFRKHWKSCREEK